MENFNNPIQMISEFNKFKNQFTGDPKQIVQNMLNTGRMSQDQFNRLQQQASEFMKILQDK